jgi:hypothetical protein
VPGIVFKNLVRIHLGGWCTWLSKTPRFAGRVGIWRKRSPLAVSLRRSCPQEFYLGSCGLSLPF